MDMQMAAERQGANNYLIWDVKVVDGNVPIITGILEEQQIATLAGFLETGTIPNLPLMGVPWMQYLTKEISFGDLDVAVRDSLQKAGADGYQPEYDIEGDKLTMSIGRVSNDTY